MKRAAPAIRIAYLTSQYPASSHTFIRREIAALRRAGLAITPFSVRQPHADELKAEVDRQAFAETDYLLPVNLLDLVSAHAHWLLRHPGTYLRALRLALRHRAPGLRALAWSLFHFAEAGLLAHRLERAGVTHLHNHFANAGATVGLLASQLAGLPWSLTLHGISETDYPAGLLLPEKLALARFVACVSWFGRAQAMRITDRAHWHKLMLVRCGIEPDQLPVRATALRAEPTIICVGRLSPEKGQDGLIEAVANLRVEGIACRLVLVGDGPERTDLETCVHRHGINDHVTFAGRLPEAETLRAIAAADLLVLPSFMEGLPVVLMEAMALGVPVVSSQVAGIPELVIDGQTGLLFPPSDWPALTAAIRRILTEPNLATTLAGAGKALVMEQFAIDKAVAPLARAFIAVSGQSPRCRD